MLVSPQNIRKMIDNLGKTEYNIQQLAVANRYKNNLYRRKEHTMNLREAQDGKEYIISKIETDDEELNAFLFSLGCYSGEGITVIRHLKGGLVVAIKDGRYNIDNQLAEAIII